MSMARKATVTNISDAMRCAKKVAQGKACTMQELKSTVLVMKQGLMTSKSKVRELKDRLAFLERMMPFRN